MTLPKLPSKESAELIIYQIGEVKNMLGNLTVKTEAMDKRVSDLEKAQAAQEAVEKNQPKIDIQKIVLTAFSVISTVVALALGINQQNIK